jgi:hypothetical protein
VGKGVSGESKQPQHHGHLEHGEVVDGKFFEPHGDAAVFL